MYNLKAIARENNDTERAEWIKQLPNKFQSSTSSSKMVETV